MPSESPPGIEPGSSPWQGEIIPLDHKDMCKARLFYAAVTPVRE